MFFISLIFCSIPIDKSTIITSLTDPNLSLYNHNKIVRLKKLPKLFFPPTSPNAIKIFINKDKFRFKFPFNSLHFSSHIIDANVYQSRDIGFKFDIVREGPAFEIRTFNGLCLEKGKLVSPTEGFYVEVKECNKSENQMFVIRLIEEVKPGVYEIEDMNKIKMAYKTQKEKLNGRAPYLL